MDTRSKKMTTGKMIPIRCLGNGTRGGGVGEGTDVETGGEVKGQGRAMEGDRKW